MFGHFKSAGKKVDRVLRERVSPDSADIKKKVELDWWVDNYVPAQEDRSWATQLAFDVAAPSLNMTSVAEWYAWLKGKMMLDMCSGPIPWEQELQPELLVCQDWLVHQYDRHGLLLKSSGRLYLNCPSEELPFLDDFFDYVHFENALDHVDSPAGSVEEAWRVLKPGGYIYVGVDLGGKPTPAEPHVFSRRDLDLFFRGYELIAEKEGLLTADKPAYNPHDKKTCVRRFYRKRA